MTARCHSGGVRVGPSPSGPRLGAARPVVALVVAALVLAPVGLGVGGCQAPLTGEREAKRDFWGRTVEGDEADGPLPPSFDPIVLPRPGARGAAATDPDDPAERERRAVEDAADEAWQAKVGLVASLIGSGDDEQALGVLDAALASSPPSPWAGRLREQKQDLRRRRVEEGLLRVDARPVKDVSAFATDVRFLIRIRNVSRVEVVFAAPEGADASASVVTLDVLRRDRDIYASLLERSWSQTVRLQEPGDPPLTLAPGALREFAVTIPADDAGPALAGVRVLEVSGTLRPARLLVRGEPETLTLRVRKGRAVILPQGFEPLAADPLGGIERALPLGAAAHVLVAAEFVTRDRAAPVAALLARALVEGEPVLVTAAEGALAMLRERCVGDPLAPLVEPLIASLEARPERAPELFVGLNALTDARLAPDARLWLDWWRRTKDRSPVVTAPTAGAAGEAAPRGGTEAPR